MNEQKLNALLQAARRAPPPVPEPGFEHQVLAALQCEAARQAAGRVPWFSSLGELLPLAARAAVAVLLLCAVAELGAGALGLPELGAGLAQLSDQWLLTASGF